LFAFDEDDVGDPFIEGTGDGEWEWAEPRLWELLLFVRGRPWEFTELDEPDASGREYGGCGRQSCCCGGGGTLDSEWDDCWRDGRRYGWKPAYCGWGASFGLGGGVPLGNGLNWPCMFGGVKKSCWGTWPCCWALNIIC
jgi:hypothetical protein